MSTTLDSHAASARAMDHSREAADQSLRDMLADLPRKITLEVTPEFYATLEQLMRDTRQNLDDVFIKAITFYKIAVDSKQEGKYVGVTDQREKLEGEFVGLGSPGGDL